MKISTAYSHLSKNYRKKFMVVKTCSRTSELTTPKQRSYRLSSETPLATIPAVTLNSYPHFAPLNLSLSTYRDGVKTGLGQFITFAVAWAGALGVWAAANGLALGFSFSRAVGDNY